ncbi:hypothetical protein GE09DRAFT_1214245 [Coniochaeta sp. 2T2.1]|nr:hypothetical protein GE09DRAFT_1214245 [Coniochaeta sp. 2T2.1]
MTGSDSHTEGHSGGIKEKIASTIRSPPVKKHDKVLANSVDHIVTEQNNSDVATDVKAADTAEMTDHEKAKLLAHQREEHAPGHFVLGDQKPAMVSQGYGEYYGAKAATQNRV